MSSPRGALLTSQDFSTVFGAKLAVHMPGTREWAFQAVEHWLANTGDIDRDPFTFNFHRRPGRVSEPPQYHRKEVAVHGLTHYIRKNCTGGTDQRTRNDQQIVSEQETRGSGGPPRK